MDNIFVTGGAGFIGSNFIHHCICNFNFNIINLDKLTYAGNVESLKGLSSSGKYVFKKCDICDTQSVIGLLNHYRPKAIIHLAAESHVDRSIDGPKEFIRTNLVGTFELLEATRSYFNSLGQDMKRKFRFLHVSTDEVYGSLGKSGAFTEETPYRPNSPYSASKAGSDHLVRAYYKTYGLPIITSNCSNNYGPFQFPEKFIPLMILNAVEGKKLPLYGKGENVRDWLYVEDHCKALLTILEKGSLGEVYNIGTGVDRTNIEVVELICEILDELRPIKDGEKYSSLITFVEDRPGHDLRYSMNINKISTRLGWRPEEGFSSALRKTVEWYLGNSDWCYKVRNGSYFCERIGLGS